MRYTYWRLYKAFYLYFLDPSAISSGYVRRFCTVLHHRPYYLGLPPDHLWWTFGQDACQKYLQSYVIYNFAQAFLTSWEVKIAMCTVMLGRIFTFPFAVRMDTRPSPLLMRNPNGFIAVRMGCRFGGFKPLGLGLWTFLINFDLDGGQEFTPILMRQGTIVLLIIPQLILHGWMKSVLNSNSNIILR